MYYKFETQTLSGSPITHIITYFDDGSFTSFVDEDWNSGLERLSYLEWLEEGNFPEEWTPPEA